MKCWLIRVTINHSLNVLKHKNKNNLIDEEYIDNLPDTSIPEENNDLYEFVSKLKDEYKTIIILYYYNDYSIKEISSILKISEQNVKTRLSRAREKLKELINRSDEYGKR